MKALEELSLESAKKAPDDAIIVNALERLSLEAAKPSTTPDNWTLILENLTIINKELDIIEASLTSSLQIQEDGGQI